MSVARRIVVIEGDEILRKKARPVEMIDQRLVEILEDMAETMYESNGIGIAGPQVGVLRRIFVVDLGDDNGLIEFINPVITNTSGVQVGIEGCLSCPGATGEVERPAELDITALDREGNEFQLHATGLMAVCISHENDHLDGVLFIDKIKGELIHS